MVYDLDGDGRAEVGCKTADGTVDGTGKVIGDAKANWRPGSDGYILDGPEFFTVFDGLTGKALATTDYVPARGNLGRIGGDAYGNRVDRFLACVAYLDGQRPSVVMCRGYYTPHHRSSPGTGATASSPQRWVFDSDKLGLAGANPYRRQGNHNLSVADVDGDGKDEIIYDSMCRRRRRQSRFIRLASATAMRSMWPTRSQPAGPRGLRHPRKPAQHPYGIGFRDARTGEMIWGKTRRNRELSGRGPRLCDRPRSAPSRL